jgi:hypothetical protein
MNSSEKQKTAAVAIQRQTVDEINHRNLVFKQER